ncbi:MAG: hypothetical protein AAFU54_23610 [Chloroflexota bacterium]
MAIFGTRFGNEAAIFGPVGDDTAHIIAFNRCWISVAPPKRPALFLHLIGNTVHAMFVLRVQLQDTLSSLVVTAPQSVLVRRVIFIARLELSIWHEPCTFGRRCQEAIIAANRAEWW